MLDKEVVGFIRKRFEESLGKNDWDELQEQLFCQFLSKNSRDVLQSRGHFLDQLVQDMEINEIRIAQKHIQARQSKDTLIIGDELGFIHNRHEQAHYLFYGAESLEYGSKKNLKNVSLIDDYQFPKGKFKKIILLQFMTQLKEWGRVRELGEFLKNIFSSLNPKGTMLVSDKCIYQDDFLIHFVSMDAEIQSIENYGQSDFLLHIKP